MDKGSELAWSLLLGACGVVVLLLLAGCSINATDGVEQVAAEVNQRAPQADRPTASAGSTTSVGKSQPPATPLPVPTPTTIPPPGSVQPTPAPPPPLPPGVWPDPPPADMLGTEPSLPEGEPQNDPYEAFTPRAVDGDIRTVDFLNGFGYAFPGFGILEVHDGIVIRGKVNDPGFIDFQVVDVLYGDLTGDGRDEAAITVGYSTAGTGFFTSVEVFGITTGELAYWGSAYGGDRAWGGVASVAITNHLLVVENWATTTGSCCPDAISTVTWEASNDGIFQLESFPPRTWVDLADTDGATREVAFRGGTTSAIVEAAAGGERSLMAFAAAGGQSLKLASDQVVTLRVWNETTGTLVGDVSANEALRLTTDGRYIAQTLTDSGEGDINFELAIADDRTLLAPQWVPRSETIVESETPRRQTTVRYPEFVFAHSSLDLEQINTTIRDFVETRRQLHLASVPQCEEHEDAYYSLDYRPTLVSYDLISLSFGEFSCLCNSGDTFRDLTLTIDLNTGHVVTQRDLVTDADALAGFWWDRASEYDPWSFENVAPGRPADLTIDNIALTPWGVLASVNPDDLDELGHVVTVSFSFDELEGLITDSFVQRARSGAAVTLPYEESCGC